MNAYEKRAAKWLFYAYALAFLLASFSLFCSFRISCSNEGLDWRLFQRSGSAMVVLALLLSTFTYRVFVDDVKKAVTWLRTGPQDIPSVIDKEYPSAPVRMKETLIKETKEAVKPILDKMTDGFEENSERSGAKILLAELILAIIGTLIWGYGDLFPFWWEFTTSIFTNA